MARKFFVLFDLLVAGQLWRAMLWPGRCVVLDNIGFVLLIFFSGAAMQLYGGFSQYQLDYFVALVVFAGTVYV